MINKIIYSVVKKCQQNWQYRTDENSCLFNTKIISSLLIYLNLISVSLLIFKRDKAFKALLFSNDQNLFLALIYPISFFILLSLIYTKRKLNHHRITPKEQDK